MSEYVPTCHSTIELEEHGLKNLRNACWNLPTPALYEESLNRNEAIMAHLGPLVVRTGQFTGRSPNDKFIVEEPTSRDTIWWGKVNRPIAEDRFAELHRRMASYLQGKDVFVQDCWCGADPDYRMPVRIVNQYAWHNLFARNMFIQATPAELAAHQPEFVVIDCPPGMHGLVLAGWRCAPNALGIVPVDGPEGLRGATRLMRAWAAAGLDAGRIRLAVTRFDRRRLLDREIDRQARSEFGGAVFESRVRESVMVRESAGWREPLVRHAPTHPVTEDLRRLAREVARV